MPTTCNLSCPRRAKGKHSAESAAPPKRLRRLTFHLKSKKSAALGKSMEKNEKIVLKKRELNGKGKGTYYLSFQYNSNSYQIKILTLLHPTTKQEQQLTLTRKAYSMPSTNMRRYLFRPMTLYLLSQLSRTPNNTSISSIL